MTCVVCIIILLDCIVTEHLLIPRRCMLHEPSPWAKPMSFLNDQVSPTGTEKQQLLSFLNPEILSALDKTQNQRDRLWKWQPGVIHTSVHSTEVTIKAHLAPQSPSGVGSRDTCVLEGGFEIDRRSKGGPVESHSWEASHLGAAPWPLSSPSAIGPSQWAKSQLPHCLALGSWANEWISGSAASMICTSSSHCASNKMTCQTIGKCSTEGSDALRYWGQQSVDQLATKALERGMWAVRKTQKVTCCVLWEMQSFMFSQWKSQPVIGNQSLSVWSRREKPEGEGKKPWLSRERFSRIRSQCSLTGSVSPSSLPVVSCCGLLSPSLLKRTPLSNCFFFVFTH